MIMTRHAMMHAAEHEQLVPMIANLIRAFCRF